MEQFGLDDGTRFLSELASYRTNLSACSEVENEYLRVHAKILEQQKYLKGCFQHMLVPRPGDEWPQNFNHDMNMMHLPQVLRPQSTKHSKYSAASSGTHTPSTRSTCSGSSELSRSSDFIQGASGLLNWEPEQDRQFLLQQIQESLLVRNEFLRQPGMSDQMTSTLNFGAANFQEQHAASGMQMPSWIDPAPTSSANLGASAQNMQPQKVPVHAHSKFPCMSQGSFPPFRFEQPVMAPQTLFPRQDPLGEPPAIAPGSLEHMQMLSKIAELQQQLNEQQKLLEAATQGSGCPTIQAIPEQVQYGKGEGVAAGYPRGLMPSMPHGLVHQKNKVSNMAKDNKNHLNDKNVKALDPQFGNSATLQTHLKALGNEDPSCIFIVRKVNRLGFRSAEMLKKFFSKHDAVVKVLVSHSKVKRNQDGSTLLRPGSLGFVLMKTPESVQKILAQGPSITVQDISIRVQPFSRLDSGVSGALEMKGDDAGDDAGDEADAGEDQD